MEIVTEGAFILGGGLTFCEIGYPDGDRDEMADDAAKSFFNTWSPHPPTSAEYKALIQEMMG